MCRQPSGSSLVWHKATFTSLLLRPSSPPAELTLDEALRAAALRREHLQAQVDARTSEVAGIRAHLRLVEQALADLAGLHHAQAQQQQS